MYTSCERARIQAEGCECSLVVEHLRSIHKTLGSIPSSAKINKIGKNKNIQVEIN